jgi:hypothetical protein
MALPRRALGTYGVYVVCIETEGCRGGGTGLPRANTGFGVGVVGVGGGEAVERLDTDGVGDGVGNKVEVRGGVGDKDVELGTTSG